MSEFFRIVIDIFLHLDKNLAIVIDQYGTLTYLLLFGIIFMETGFVVTPFLPGDSLLFAGGALSATSSLNIWIVYLLLLAAAILGDTVNYWIGHYIRPRILDVQSGLFKDSRFIKRKHLEDAHDFYEKHGGIAIVLARFIPILRTFAPFVAGIAKMSYGHFISYNIIGGFLWVTLFLWGGYFFGNLPFVKENFHYVVLAIIILSLTPVVYEIAKSKRKSLKSGKKVSSGH